MSLRGSNLTLRGERIAKRHSHLKSDRNPRGKWESLPTSIFFRGLAVKLQGVHLLVLSKWVIHHFFLKNLMIDVCCAFSRLGIVFFIVISPCFCFLGDNLGMSPGHDESQTKVLCLGKVSTSRATGHRQEQSCQGGIFVAISRCVGGGRGASVSSMKVKFCHVSISDRVLSKVNLKEQKSMKVENFP